MGTIGSPVDPIKPPPLPDVDVDWKLEGVSQTETEKDADSTATIKVSAKLVLGNRPVGIADLTCLNYMDKYFSERFPPSGSATPGSTPAPTTAPTPTPAPTPAPTPGTPSDLTFEKKVLRCKFHLEYEKEFNSKTVKEKFEVKLTPKCAVVEAIARIKHVEQRLEKKFNIDLVPCALQLYEPLPRALGDPNHNYNPNTVLKARIVRKKDKAVMDPTAHIGIRGQDIIFDSDIPDPSPRIWLEFVFHAPKERPWITETLHKMAIEDPHSKYDNMYKVIPWDGSHFQGGIKKTDGPFSSSNDWFAHKYKLPWEHHLKNKGKTPQPELREKKKAAGHILGPTAADDNGFLKFGSDPNVHFGYTYDHGIFKAAQGLGRDDIFYDLRNVSCTNYKSTPLPGQKDEDYRGSVQFALWFNQSDIVAETKDWELCKERTVEILVPGIHDDGEIPAGSKDWFLENSCHESLAIFYSKHTGGGWGAIHEFHKPGGDIKRKMWGAHPDYLCHDFAWRQPGDRYRVDLLGRGGDWVLEIKANPEKFGYKKLGWSSGAQLNDIIVYKKDNNNGKEHSAVVLSITSPTKLLCKDIQNGIFECTDAKEDDFNRRYGQADDLTWLRRTKCYFCRESLPAKGLEDWCPKCGPAPPGTWGIADWTKPRPDSDWK